MTNPQQPEPYDPGRTYPQYPPAAGPPAQPPYQQPTAQYPAAGYPLAAYPAPPAPPQKKPAPTWLVIAAVVLVAFCGLAVVVGALSGDPETDTAAETDPPAGQSAAPAVEQPTAEPSEEPPAEPEPEPESELTVPQEQAVGTAEDYLDYSGFSRQGLIDQLEFEGFTTEQAEYGVTEAGL